MPLTEPETRHLQGVGLRIAVLRPQVPFSRGGARSWQTGSWTSSASGGTRRISSPSRSSGTPAPGCSRRRSSGGCSTWTRRTGARSTSSSPRVPLVPRPPPREARLAAPSVPPGIRAGRDRARPVRRLARGARAPAGRCRRSTAWRSPRRHGSSRHPERRRPARALDRSRRRGASAPAPGARVPVRRLRRLRPLRQPARPSEADRPPARGRGARPVARDRDRGEGPDRGRLGGARAERGRWTVALASRGVSPRTKPADLYGRCLAVYYAPVDEDFGMVPFEAFLSEKPRPPTRTQADRSRSSATGAPASSSRRTRRARAGRGLADPPRRGGHVRPRREGIAEGVTWSRAVERLLA